jgi:hypothetical protein
MEGSNVVLYSESDPRDPRCLVIALFPSALKEILKEGGLEPAANLQGKKIRVRDGTPETSNLNSRAADLKKKISRHGN